MTEQQITDLKQQIANLSEKEVQEAVLLKLAQLHDLQTKASLSARQTASNTATIKILLIVVVLLGIILTLTPLNVF